MIPEYKWDSSKPYARSYIWNEVLLPLVDSYDIKPTDNILELTHNDKSVITEHLQNRNHTGEVDVLNVKSKQASYFQELNTQHKRYDIVLCFLYLEEIHFELNTIMTFIHHVLNEGGRLYIALPFINLHTSARETFQQVIDSGEYNEITQSSIIHNTTLIPQIESSIKSAFPAFHINTYKNDIELPSLTFFMDFLHEVAFMYKKVISSDLNEKVIQRQAEYFEENCKKKHKGKYMFHYELNVYQTLK